MVPKNVLRVLEGAHRSKKVHMDSHGFVEKLEGRRYGSLERGEGGRWNK